MVAFYLRLSKADGEEEESNSICSQREILRQSLSQYGFLGEDVIEYVEMKTLNLIQSFISQVHKLHKLTYEKKDGNRHRETIFSAALLRNGCPVFFA